MKNQTLFLKECEELKVPKYVQNILAEHIVLSKSEITDSYLLYNSKHATLRALEWRYEKLTEWIKRNGGTVLECRYDWDKEYCKGINKFYPFRFRFPSFNKYKSIFAHVGYLDI